MTVVGEICDDSLDNDDDGFVDMEDDDCNSSQPENTIDTTIEFPSDVCNTENIINLSPGDCEPLSGDDSNEDGNPGSEASHPNGNNGEGEQQLTPLISQTSDKKPSQPTTTSDTTTLSLNHPQQNPSSSTMTYQQWQSDCVGVATGPCPSSPPCDFSPPPELMKTLHYDYNCPTQFEQKQKGSEQSSSPSSTSNQASTTGQPISPSTSTSDTTTNSASQDPDFCLKEAGRLAREGGMVSPQCMPQNNI